MRRPSMYPDSAIELANLEVDQKQAISPAATQATSPAATQATSPAATQAILRDAKTIISQIAKPTA